MRPLVIACGLAFAVGVASSTAAAESEEELLGKWSTGDAKDPPMEFLKDGKFKFGWTKQKDGWKMASGTFKVDKDGKIKANAMSGSVGLTLELKPEKGSVTGSVDGKTYTGKKEEEKKEPKKDP